LGHLLHHAFEIAFLIEASMAHEKRKILPFAVLHLEKILIHRRTGIGPFRKAQTDQVVDGEICNSRFNGDSISGDEGSQEPSPVASEPFRLDAGNGQLNGGVQFSTQCLGYNLNGPSTGKVDNQSLHS
jgi:hypothetical protein